MKKLLIVVGILVAINCVSAQENSRMHDARKKKIAAYQDRLELTDAQIESLKSIHQNHKSEREKLRADESKSKSEKMRVAADLIDIRESEVATVLSNDQLAERNKIQEENKIKRQVMRTRRRARHGWN